MQYAFLAALEKAAQSYLHPLFQRFHGVTQQEIQAHRGSADPGFSPVPSHRAAGDGVMKVVDPLTYADLFWEEA